MMNFEIINQAIIDLLGSSAAGRFTVTGFQQQGGDASEVKGNKRSVVSYYSSGRFSKSSGRQFGTTQHALSFTIGCTCSAAARINLSAMTNPNATAGQMAAALSALQEAAYLADKSMDELFRIVYQILMDARNYDIGLPIGTVANRWVDEMTKDAPIPNGELVVLTGAIQFFCSTSEDVDGEKCVTVSGGVGVQLDIFGDDVERAGVITGGV